MTNTFRTAITVRSHSVAPGDVLSYDPVFAAYLSPSEIGYAFMHGFDVISTEDGISEDGHTDITAHLSTPTETAELVFTVPSNHYLRVWR